jgi:hypothetical protein
MINGRSNQLAWMALLATSACFELEVVEGRQRAGTPPGPLLIDNFEDGDRVPSSSLFSAWTCLGSEPEQSVSCQTAEGLGSTGSRSLRYQFTDVPDAALDDPEAVLRSGSRIKLDISGYEKLVFSARHVTESTPPPRRTLLSAVLFCSDDAFAEPYGIESSVQPTAEWQTFALPLVDFVAPSWEKRSIDAVYCSMTLEYLYFLVRPTLNDGESVTGQLWLDDVYLQ